MASLSSQQVLKDKQTRDPNSIAFLSLTHKFLSDVSCLSEFKNLERLDLAFNSLTSIEGLRSCINLKWLSVVQNKLQSLSGIQALSKLTVLNAGKNKLKSMDEVRPLVSLRALILNDNEIVTISGLDQMKELNTLVLSRNPVCEIGESLSKVKSITKLSLSYCELWTIGSSLKYCIELKELRLAHNEITALPVELSYNKNLQNLDLGNNVIIRWTDVKVLSSLVGLKNLNLLGNPIAEKVKLVKKIQHRLPNLHVFNARTINKVNKGGNGDTVERNDDFARLPPEELEVHKKKRTKEMKEKKFSTDEMNQQKSNKVGNASDLEMEKDFKEKRKNARDKHSVKQEIPFFKDNNAQVEKKVERKTKKKNDDLLHKGLLVQEDGQTTSGKKKKRQRPEEQRGEIDIFDDRETSFADLLTVNAAESPKLGGLDKIGRIDHDITAAGGMVSVTVRRKRHKIWGKDPTGELTPAAEIGMGGQSTWGDE
uniref:Protein phosphatase 1 regulatory subunit 7 n=2 Tax=Rhizophora mucronata TaxID=61149 RepID=A0A2P2J894_RHIMU